MRAVLTYHPRDVAAFCETHPNRARRAVPTTILVWPGSICLYPANRVKLGKPLARACLLANLAHLAGPAGG